MSHNVIRKLCVFEDFMVVYVQSNTRREDGHGYGTSTLHGSKKQLEAEATSANNSIMIMKIDLVSGSCIASNCVCGGTQESSNSLFRHGEMRIDTYAN
jgi:hypothetical protein